MIISGRLLRGRGRSRSRTKSHKTINITGYSSSSHAGAIPKAPLEINLPQVRNIFPDSWIFEK